MGAPMEITSALTTPTRVRRIAARRRVLWRLVASDLKVKYEGSTLGYIWSVLEPALLTAVYYVVFTVLRSREPEPYVLFLASGILPWQWVTGTINGSLRSLRGNSKLITKIDLPREIFPLSIVTEKGLEFIFALPVLMAVAAVYTVAPSAYAFAMPLAFLMQLALLTGVALMLSATNTLLRDVERVIHPIVRVIFYLSAILFPTYRILDDLQRLSPLLATLYQVNPVVGIMELYRAMWFPQNFLGWDVVAAGAGGCVLFLVVGWWMFTRLETQVLKEL